MPGILPSRDHQRTFQQMVARDVPQVLYLPPIAQFAPQPKVTVNWLGLCATLLPQYHFPRQLLATDRGEQQIYRLFLLTIHRKSLSTSAGVLSTQCLKSSWRAYSSETTAPTIADVNGIRFTL